MGRARILGAAIAAVVALAACTGGAPVLGAGAGAGASPRTPRPTPAATTPSPPSSELRLYPAMTITGDITPKSVDASGSGLFVAQNMIYTHTVTVYDRDGSLLRTIPDTVDLARFGYPEYPAPVQGGPVEAAFSADRRYVYVSNYSMYGPGFSRPGHDSCAPSYGYDRSFVYRIDLRTFAIDQVIRVGSVPKYVAVTPDGRLLLVSDWCSYDLSVIDTATARVVKVIGLGPYPRGIAVDPSSSTAYVAVMGGTSIAKVDLSTFAVSWISGVGQGPRHLDIDPKGRYLYATLNAEGRVAKIDLATDRVVAKAATGSAPRSMAISADGRSLYVVNYYSNSVSKVLTDSMRVVQTVPTNPLPIGVTYDAPTRQVWVSCYSGSIDVFVDGVSP